MIVKRFGLPAAVMTAVGQAILCYTGDTFKLCTVYVIIEKMSVSAEKLGGVRFMKVKISNSKAGETRVDYIKVSDKLQFRFRLLKRIIEDFDNNVVLFADTNQSLRKNRGLDTLELLRQTGAEPLAVKIPAGKEQFFGIQLNLLNKDDIEYMICLELKGDPLTEAVFKALSTCDIAIGINQIEPIANQYGLVGVTPALILAACFKSRVYDSVICSRINSNFDISRFVEEITHEMGL